MLLTPEAVGNAEMILGGIDKAKFKGDLVYSPLSGNTDGIWQVTSSQISVNGKTLPTLTGSFDFAVDSGTSNVVLDPKIVEVSIFV